MKRKHWPRGHAAGALRSHLHQDEERGEEQKRRPLHSVQNDLELMDVGQDQQPDGAQDSDPPWGTRNACADALP